MTKTQLALRYFPGSDPENARKKLMRWLAKDRLTLYTLQTMGYNKRDHFLTPAMIEVIRDRFGTWPD